MAGVRTARRTGRLAGWVAAWVAGLVLAGGLVEARQAAAPAQAPAPPPELALDRTLPVDPAVRIGRLDNGLRFYIRRNERPDDRVSLRLAVDAGSIQEEADQRGLAHFLEHMAFNGTRHFKPGELIDFLESIGARFGPHVNAYTSFDETVYMLDVPTDREGLVDRALLVMADFAGGISLIGEEVDKERGVVIEEWRGRLGANSRITDQQFPVLFRGSRYAERLPIGDPEVLKTFPRERVVAFYERWYRPDRMAVSVVGDIDPAQAEQLVRKHFGALPAATGQVPAIDKGVPAHDDTLYSVVTDPEAQGWTVSLVSKRPLEIATTVGDYRDSLVDQLVVQMLNLRLRDLARRPDAPFLGAQTGGASLGRTVDLFQLTAVTPEGQLARGLEALVLEARRAQQFGFSAAELERAKAATLAFYEQAYKERTTTESPSYAMEYVRAFLEQEPIPGIEFEYQVASTYVPGVTMAEIKAATEKLLRPDSNVVLAVAPEKKDVPAPTEASLRETVARASAAPVEPWADATAGRALVEDPPAPGKVTARRTVPEIGATVLTLSNGVEVWLKPTDFKNDQVLFGAQAKGGASLAAPADYLEANLSTGLVGVGGIGGLNPVDLSKLLAGKIAQASPTVGEYTHGVAGQTSPRDLETALQLAYLTFTAPNLTPESFELLKRQLAGLLGNQAQNPRFVFRERVQQVNTSGHYSAEAPEPADVPTLDLAAMKGFYEQRFANAADFTWFFVGAFEVDQVVPLLERWVASLPSTGKATSAFRDMGVKFPASVVKEEVRKGREPVSQTVISFFADTGLDELEMHRARAAASLLGIRLRDILREELGGTYGVGVNYASALPLPGYGAMRVQYGSSPENVATLSAEVLKEVERLKAEGPTAEDVAKVQELERRDLETSVKENQYWIGSIQTVHLLGWDPAGIARRAERIEKLSPDVLHEAFRKYFPMDRYTIVTLKPETAQ